MGALIRTGEKMVIDPEWQRLWFTLQERPWASLAVIGTDEGTDVDLVARTLAAIGNRDGQIPVQAVSALGLSFADVPRILGQISLASEGKALTIVSCDPLRRNPAAIPIVHAASGVVLVVRLGQSMREAVTKTVDAVGRDRVFASVTVG